jgi:hypothetical protein
MNHVPQKHLFLSVLVIGEVTRNTRDVARTGVRLLNPFEPQHDP